MENINVPNKKKLEKGWEGSTEAWLHNGDTPTRRAVAEAVQGCARDSPTENLDKNHR